MNALMGVGIVAGVIYNMLVDGTYFKIYLACLFTYYILTQHIFLNKGDVTRRKKIMISTWSSPGDPTAYVPFDYDVTKTLEYLKKLNDMQKDTKITMTHIFSMAMGLALSKSRRDIGRIAWGNF